MSKKYSLFILLSASALAFGQSKLGPELQTSDLKGNVHIIVQFDQDPGDAHHQKVISRGGSWRGTLHSVKGGAYSVPAAAIAELAKDPSVVHISQDHKIFAKNDYATAATNATIAWQQFGVDGTGIGVAVLDSGISQHGDLAGKGSTQRVVYTQDFVNGDGQDRYGHGQHIAGIIAGNGADSECAKCVRKLKGMAPGANLINLRVLDQNGESTDSTIISAIDTAISLKKTYNIRVMNLSLGRPVFESYKLDPLCQAVEAAWKAGIVVVVAAGNEGRDNTAGNEGYGTITSPANDPFVITVGAMKSMGTYDRTDDLIASYSSKGPTLVDNIVKPDIVAPGNKIVSLLASPKVTLASEYPQDLIPVSYYDGSNSNSKSALYYALSGTSMAAAVVSGAVADLLQAQPYLSPDQVKARLMRTAYKTFPQSSVAVDPVTGISYVSYYDIFTVGAGYLDLAAALQSKDLAFGNAMSPYATFNSLTNKVYLVYNPLSTWGLASLFGQANSFAQSAVWGANAVWGTTVVNADRSLWSESAVWGMSSSWGASAVWGASLLNAERSLWSESAVWGAATQQSEGPPITVLGEQ